MCLLQKQVTATIYGFDCIFSTLSNNMFAWLCNILTGFVPFLKYGMCVGLTHSSTLQVNKQKSPLVDEESCREIKPQIFNILYIN